MIKTKRMFHVKHSLSICVSRMISTRFCILKNSIIPQFENARKMFHVKHLQNIVVEIPKV